MNNRILNIIRVRSTAAFTKVVEAIIKVSLSHVPGRNQEKKLVSAEQFDLERIIINLSKLQELKNEKRNRNENGNRKGI